VRISKITIILVATIVAAFAMLMVQGDICDQANDPEQCRIELPER
jgi:hypothetical protein